MLKSRRPTCFYCGTRSTQKLPTNVRKFECEHCEAVNHLDANGQITDPPVSSDVSTASVRYARPQARSSSPEPSLDTSNLFCSTCLKNQHLHQQNLASYLPSESSPDYQKYLQSYDTYCERLDKRYPQVCSRCAPKVREQIRRAGYVAKTDFLQRMVERSRGGVLYRTRTWGYIWRTALFKIAAVGWYTSIACQAAHHAILADPVAMYDTYVNSDDNGMRDRQHNWLARASTSLSLTRLPTLDLHQYMLSLLPLSILLLWWNPRLHERYCGNSGGRLTHLFDYYCLQLVLLIVRAFAFFTLSEQRYLSIQKYRGSNAFVAVYIIVSSMIASRVVQIDNRPRVSFHARDEDLLPDVPDQSVDAGFSLDPQPKAQGPGLDISKLAPRAPQNPLSLSSTLPPTPPPDMSETDYRGEAMDWSPTETVTQPFSNTNNVVLPRKASSTHSSLLSNLSLDPRNTSSLTTSTNPFRNSERNPSAFTSSIPPAPPSRMQHPRAPNPPVHPSFTRAAPAQQATFAQSFGQRPRKTRRTLFGEEIDVDDDSDDSSVVGSKSRWRNAREGTGSADRREMTLRPATFSIPQPTSTGLESLFDEVFTFDDAPVFGRQSESESRLRSQSSWPPDSGTNARNDGNEQVQGRSTGQPWVKGLIALVPALFLGLLVMSLRGHGFDSWPMSGMGEGRIRD